MCEPKSCILCGGNSVCEGIGALNYSYKYICPNCGTFCVSDTFNRLDDDMLNQIPRHLLSGYVREKNVGGNRNICIDTENYKLILESPLIPHNSIEKRNKLLLWYYKKTSYFGQWIEFEDSPSICYAVNKDELENYYELVFDEYLVSQLTADLIMKAKFPVHLTIEGHKLCYDLIEQTSNNSVNAFIAMWFSNEIRDAYEEAIKPAIEECGFQAFRVDNHEHNNDITDEIIAGIKNSRFVIADLSGYRAGVYYEAGFARGLGKPVIFTCNKSWFDGPSEENKRIHFDVNHLNIIVWEDLSDLKEKIINRINATIL